MSRSCQACLLPVAVRVEAEDQLRRRQVPLRTVAAYLTDLGFSASKDGLHRHLTRCIAPLDDAEIEPPSGDGALLVALAAADILRNWESMANRLALRLNADGLHDAAKVVISHVSADYRPSLEATAGTDVQELLSCRALARAVGAVLSERAPEVSEAIAHYLAAVHADVLAADFRELAQRATNHLSSPTTSEASP